MTKALLYLALLASAFIVLRNFLVPYLLGRFTPIRIQSFSLRNIRGIEWHPRDRGCGDSAAPLRVGRLGWEWCPGGRWGIVVVAEQIEVSTQHDLAELRRMDKSSGNARIADPTGLSKLLQRYVTSKLKLYIQPTVLSLGMRYLPFILHLVMFRISNVRFSPKDESVVFLSDYIDASFDVRYDQTPAVISSESALEPETPVDVTSPAPPPTFSLSSVNAEGTGTTSTGEGSRVRSSRRGWDSLWRRVMYRASGDIHLTVNVSQCRLLRGVTSEPVDSTITEIVTIAGRSTFEIAIAFGALEDRRMSDRVKKSAVPHPSLLASYSYLAFSNFDFAVQLPPIQLRMRQLEQLLDDLQRKKDVGVAHRQIISLDDPHKRDSRNKQLAKAIGRALNVVSLRVSRITFHHSLEASYLAPKVAARNLDPVDSHDSGISASLSRDQSAAAASPGNLSMACIIDDFYLRVQSVNQANSPAIRDIFGRQTEADKRRGELVRGLEFKLNMQDVFLQRHGPAKGEASSTIVCTGPIQVTAVTTIFSGPMGWQSFPKYIDEPNQYLLHLEVSVTRFRFEASADMVTQLILGFRSAAASRRSKRQINKHVKPRSNASNEPGQLRQKVPKLVVVCRIGEVDIHLADTEADPLVHCCISNTGLHLAGHTEHQDVQARRLTRDSKLKPRFSLFDGYTSAINWECGGQMAATKVTFSSYADRATDETIEVIRIGKGFLRSSGSMLGRSKLSAGNIDFDINSKMGSLTLSLSTGVEVCLWRAESQRMLAHFISILEICQSMLQRPRNDARNAVVPDPLRSLPSGISIKLSLGSVAVTLASQDPNPRCQLQLLRGLRFQTVLTLDYCYFAHEAQAQRSNRLLLEVQHRSKLHLSPGLEVEAEAFANKYAPCGGGAALFGAKFKEVLVIPVFNAGADAADQGASAIATSEVNVMPEVKRHESIAIWDFQKKDKAAVTSPVPGPNNRDPFNVEYGQQIRRPILVVPEASIGLNVVRQAQDGPMERQIIARVGYTEVSGDLSHVYCVMLAIHALKACRRKEDSVGQASHEPSARHRIETTLRLRMDYFELDLLFPIGERVFGSFSELHCAHRPHCQNAKLRSGMFFVPSARESGKFEELGRFKNLAFTIDKGSLPMITVSADAFRIRVPYQYEPARLFLNVKSAIKASQLLFHAVHTSEFRAVLLPKAQPVKSVPSIHIRFKSTSFEIKDDPLETKLNLSFRVGKTESAPRTERRAYFDAKAALINSTMNPAEKTHKQTSQRDLERIRERYNVTLDHTVPVPEARERLWLYDSEKWIKKMRKARHTQNRREERELIRQYGYKTDYSGLPIEVVAPQRFAPLFRSSMDDLSVSIKDPNFDSAALLAHMESHGGPFPSNQQFSLRVPLDIQFQSDNADFTLRDYPLPLWRVMPIADRIRESDGTVPALACSLTIVFAEELADDQETYFLIPCTVIPQGIGDSQAAALTLEIAKTLAPVKSYADIKFKIQSSRPTDFAWGVSYGFAISDLTRAFAGFSHPPRDPSPRLGFWDKFRHSLHWRVAFDFAAPCHLHLKGSRDPYEITGYGAGFVLAWMGNPRIRIGYSNPEHELVQITSDQMVLSVPDLTAFLDPSATGDKHDPHVDSGKKTEELPSLLNRRLNKTCANFRGGVCVGFAFKFERTCRDNTCERGCQGKASMRQCRFFDFLPHHAVRLRTPQTVKRLEQVKGIEWDSYEGFRSDFIHFSPSIVANTDSKPRQESSFHFTPKGFAHFFAWWNLFSHVMSLPIRQGTLFPSSPPKSKKFGRSLATIKYRFDIHDLYISHIYPQYSSQDWATGIESSVGVKLHIVTFQADLHQREQFQIRRSDALGITTPTHKAFYAGEVILTDIKVKAIRAVFDSPADQPLRPSDQSTETHTRCRGTHAKKLQGHDADWFHVDDYVDTDVRPVDDNPLIELYTYLSAPLCRYSRYIPALRVSSEVIGKLQAGKLDATETSASKFGREPTHKCLLSEAPVLEEFSDLLVNKRIAALRKMRDSAVDAQQRVEMEGRIKILEDGLEGMHFRMQTPEYPIDRKNSVDGFDARERMSEREGAGYENVFHVHCPRLSIDNTTRNILLQYYFSSRMRRGFEYHMSHKAVADLQRQLEKGFQQKQSDRPAIPKPNLDLDDVASKMGSTLAAGILGQLLGDHTRVNTAGHAKNRKGTFSCDITPDEGMPKEYGIRKSMFGVMTQPQILLSSEADSEATVLFTANMAELRSFRIEDGEYAGDKVKEVVMRRNYGTLDGLQSFYPSDKSYGAPESPTFVPMEHLLNAKLENRAFDRLVASTQCSLRLDNFNQLRLVNKSSDSSSEHLRNHQDLAVVNVPTFGVVANSRHFAAMYSILTDLVLYQDPEQRQRSQQLDTFLYSFDAEDRLRYSTEVKYLQNRIREQESTHRIYEEHYDRLSDEGKLEVGRIRSDLSEDIQKLSLIFDAIAILQIHSKAAAELRSSLRLEAHAQELAWFMLDEDKLLAKLAIKDIRYTWVRKKDSSTENALVVRDLQALNTSPDAYFVEIISRYEKAGLRDEAPMVQASWSALAPVGGISILESFKLQLHPLRVQLERAIGRSLNDYVFANRPAKTSTLPDRKAKKKQRSGDREQLENINDYRGKQHLGIPAPAGSRSLALAGSPNLSRQSSDADMALVKGGLSRANSSGDLSVQTLSRQVKAEAEEMRSRASRNRTFIFVDIEPTTLLFSYKSDKAKSFSNVQDIRVKTPQLLYENKVWSFEDLARFMRKDMLRSAWNQKGQLLSDIFRKKTRPVRSQYTAGPSNLSTIYNKADIGNTSDIDSMEEQEAATPVLPDVVALVKTPQQLDDLQLEAGPANNDNRTQETSPASSQHSLDVPTHFQQSLENQMAAKKSGRMNKLITKFRHHKRD